MDTHPVSAGRDVSGVSDRAAPATHVVFTGGPSPTSAEALALSSRLARTRISRAVAADSGLDMADCLGSGDPVVAVQMVIGDMDSVDPARLAQAASDGIEVERFPTDKDATDLELALDEIAAAASVGDRIVVLGTTSGRFDHVLATLLVLASPAYAAFDREAWLGLEVIHVVTGSAAAPSDAGTSLDLAAGTTLSILAVHGDAVVSVSGVRWPLHDEVLAAGTSRGVSNIAVGGDESSESGDGRPGDGGVVVSVRSGTVMVVVPGDQPVASSPDGTVSTVSTVCNSTDSNSTDSNSTDSNSTDSTDIDSTEIQEERR
jgi:thiamine pyrophosphokinase